MLECVSNKQYCNYYCFKSYEKKKRKKPILYNDLIYNAIFPNNVLKEIVERYDMYVWNKYTYNVCLK